MGRHRARPCSSPPDAITIDPERLAILFFTSGSTGTPKGVCYEHGMFEAQVRLIRETYAIAPGEVDLPLLPIFALFNPALGMTTIVPELDPRRPAEIDPAKIVQAIQQESVTNSFGSPTLWQKICDHCRRENIQLPTLRRVLCAGAPVPAALWQASRTVLPNGKLHSPYGATEALPVATVSSDEVDVASVRGACVGRPLAANEVKIIAITDAMPHTSELVTVTEPMLLGSGSLSNRQEFRLPDEVPSEMVYSKGSVRRVEVNRYERDPQARLACLAEYGTDCCICGFRPALSARSSLRKLRKT